MPAPSSPEPRRERMPSQLRTAGLLPDLSAESASTLLVTSLTTTPPQDHAEREDADMASPHTTSSVDADMADLAADSHADTRLSATSQSQRSELDTPDGSTATTDSSDPSEETTSPRVSNGDI